MQFLNIEREIEKNIYAHMLPLNNDVLYSELTVHFQPIFTSRGDIYGYEALTRHKSKKINIQNLFDEAKKKGTHLGLNYLAYTMPLRRQGN